jgi:hypothetical protein
MRTTSSLTALIALAALAAAPARAADPQPPKGFTALFNGKDLSGWHGMPHFDPYKLAAMPEAERQAQIEKWTADARKHWKVENGELVNDGSGAYLTTDREFGDIELLIEYKTVPQADSGIYLRATPQVQIWDYTKEGGKWNLGADKGSGGLWNNSPGAPGKDPLVRADKPFGQWNSFRILLVGEARHGVPQRQAGGRFRPVGELLEPQAAAAAQRADPAADARRRIHWRNVYLREIPPAEANALLRQHGAAWTTCSWSGCGGP